MRDVSLKTGAVAALREYRTTDLDAMFRLDQLCFAPEFRFDRSSMLQFAEAGNAVTVVAETDEGRVIGFVIAHLERGANFRAGYLITLDVAPDFRRIGLAGRMMDVVERRVVEAGSARMDLHVFTGNEAAIRFYEARGYVSNGLKRRFYGARIDALSYRKEL